VDLLVPFQMVYEGGVERLAAESLLERQKWVNRIWCVCFFLAFFLTPIFLLFTFTFLLTRIFLRTQGSRAPPAHARGILRGLVCWGRR
jgi:hypothetical protein